MSYNTIAFSAITAMSEAVASGDKYAVYNVSASALQLRTHSDLVSDITAEIESDRWKGAWADSTSYAKGDEVSNVVSGSTLQRH